jgi:invasion protein IalB
MSKNSVATAVLLAAVLAAGAAHAQATKVVNKFNDWVLYTHSGEPATICFISAQPRETAPAGYNKDRSYFYVSAWPNDGVKAEVSVKMGKDLRDGSNVSVQIGNARFSLFVKGDKAFVTEATEELKLLDAMKRGSFMKVSATTNDGTSIEDTYSLIGVTAAVNSLSEGCN